MLILKRKVIYISVILLSIAIFLFFLYKINSPIKNPIVKCGSKEISVIKTDFTYKSIFKRKNNYHSTKINPLKSIKIADVPPNKKINFNFKKKPKSYMVVSLLDNGNYKMALNVKEGQEGKNYITTPKDHGKYTYSISTEYNEGLGIYYFSINVH